MRHALGQKYIRLITTEMTLELQTPFSVITIKKTEIPVWM